MCDLLGLTFTGAVYASISLDLFQLRGAANPDGWGIAFYDGPMLQLVKEARAATNSSLYDFVESYPRSDTFVSHVRRSSRGVMSYVNTHPFYRVLTLGGVRKEFSFAHNGTLTDMSGLETQRFAPIGETDSERLFCYILEQIDRRGITTWERNDLEFLHNTIQGVNTEENTMNLLLSDGEYLFCYSDENRHNGGLRYIEQTFPFNRLEFVEEGVSLGSVEIASENVDESEDIKTSGYVIVTRALANLDWTEFPTGGLVVFRQGTKVYPE